MFTESIVSTITRIAACTPNLYVCESMILSLLL